MRQRIYFTVLNAKEIKVPAYTYTNEGFNSYGELAAKSLAKKNNWRVLVLNYSGYDSEGRIVYRVTLGSPSRYGGFAPKWHGQIIIEKRGQ